MNNTSESTSASAASAEAGAGAEEPPTKRIKLENGTHTPTPTDGTAAADSVKVKSEDIAIAATAATTATTTTPPITATTQTQKEDKTTSSTASTESTSSSASQVGGGSGGSSVVTAGSSPHINSSHSSHNSNSSHDSLTDATATTTTSTATAATTTTKTAVAVAARTQQTAPSTAAATTAVAAAVSDPKQVATTPLSTTPSTTVIATAPVAATTTTKAAVAVLPSKPTSTTTSRVVSSSSPIPIPQSQPQPQSVASSSTSTLTTATAATIQTTTAAASSAAADVPLKALNFGHLQIKYLGELEYMLREFRKLERQLLGAKGAAQLEESAGSRERREKLHSFILHLEDTIRQIELGCKLEDEGKLSSTCTKDSSSSNDQQHANATTDSADKSASDNSSSSSNDAIEEAKKQQMAEESALSNLTKEKEEEENVQKLEEHILANLLPVKVRLKKQLAAQQGATQNPAGMPSLRRGSLQPPSTARGKGTFAEAAEKRRKQAEAARLAAQEQRERAVRNVSDPSQFGKPLSGGGSSLTQKLHGSTLGSKQRRGGSGVGTPSKLTPEVVKAKLKDAPVVAAAGVERKILYAGMVPGSTQQKSGLSAASGAHEMVVTSNNQSNNTIESSANSSAAPTATTTPTLKSTNVKSAVPVPVVSAAVQASRVITKATTTIAVQPKRIITAPKATNVEAKTITTTTVVAKATTSSAIVKQKKPVVSSSAPLSEEEKLKFKKHRRKRKILRLARRRERERLKQQNPKSQQITSTQQTPSNNPTAVRKKVVHHHSKGPKKKGPRVVEYICSLCSEAYSSTCDLNPWWALAQHKCPKCQKTQIPRIDITSPANIIEYHPALLSHLEDGGRGGGNAGSIHSQAVASATMHVVSQIPGIGAAKTSTVPMLDSESDSDLSELSDDDISIGSLKAAELEADIQSMTPAERAEHETFGDEYEGPRLSDEHASKLLILMGHASTCPCHHKSEKEKDICRSTKYMMLHVRDCPGTTSTFDVCPFPWCRKVKHLLYHLVSCSEPDQCSICSPKDLPKGLEGLVGLNAHRMKGHRERMIAAAKATLKAKTNPVAKPPPVNGSATATQTNNLRKVIIGATLSAAQAPAAQESAPLNSKIECVPAQVTSNPSTITAAATVDTGVNGNSHVPNPVTIAQAHDPLTQTNSDSYEAAMSQEDSQEDEDEDFDINAEIAKLDEQLDPDPSEESYSASDKNHFLQTAKTEASHSGSIALPQSPLAPLTRDSSDGTSVPSDKLAMSNLNASTNSANCPTSSNITMAYENSNGNAEISTEDEQVLPTPIFAIKMEDNDADADAAEVSDLLAPSDVYVSAEEQTDFKLDPDFLETSDAITTSDFAMVAGDFSDTTADNNDMIVIASEVAAAAVSIESTPDVATATAAAVVAAAAAATEVNVEHTNTAGGVKVN